nr:MAG TPA: hypothetical protein [Caudoviricetes sp.]
MQNQNLPVYPDEIPAEIVAPTTNVLDVQERATIDIQISTAKHYPRSLETFTRKAVAYATIDEDTAESCIYRRPVGKDKNGKQTYAEGMSVRTAEIVGSCFGNLRVASRIIEQTDRYVKAEGVAFDLESNFSANSQIIEPTVDKYGKPYNERMRIVIAKAALAKARRDATFMVVPKALAKPIETAVRNLLYGTAQSLTRRRAAVEAWIKKLGIDERRVYAALEVGGVLDMNERHLETLTGLRTAIKDGEVSIDEAFPEVKSDKVRDARLFSAESAPILSKFEKRKKEASKTAAESESKDAKNVETEPKQPEKTDLEKIAEVIDKKGIPVSAEEVKAFVEKNGEFFSFAMVEPNLDAIAEAILGGK